MSGLNVNTINDGSGGNTATINGIPLRPGVLDPENRIINGAFDFWQRGTSTSTTNTFGADRWAHLFSGGAATQSRQSFSIGDTLGTSNPTYFMRQSVTGQSAAGNYANVTQRIEGVATYAGQTITVLGWARRSSGTGNMSIDTFQYFGTGGSPSATTSQTAQVVTLSGSWSPFAATFSLPTVSGKTLGTNLNDFLGIRIWSSAGTSFSSIGIAAQTIDVDLWGIHIKVGTHTTAAVDLYRQPELGPELARCQRYYEVLPINGSGFGLIAAYYAASDWRAFWPFKVVKRATPSTTASTWFGVNPPTNYPSPYIIQYYGTTGFFSTAQLVADAEL